MNISITGKHMDVGEALSEHVNSRLAEGIKKQLNRVNIIKVDIVFSKINYLYNADIIINTAGRIGTIKSSDKAADTYMAFDGALQKVENQIRRYLGRIEKITRDEKALNNDIDGKDIRGTKYVMPASLAEEVTEEDKEPVTIAEKPTNIERLSVQQAIMKMDLSQLPALLFINTKNDRLNIVYHRADGNISWVDPELENK